MNKTYYLTHRTYYKTTSTTLTYQNKKYTLLLKIKELENILSIYRSQWAMHKLNKRIMIVEDGVPTEIIENIKSYQEHMRIKKQRDKERSNVIQDFKETLSKQGIDNSLALLLTGTRKRRNRLKNINTIIDKTLNSDIDDTHIMLCIEKIWRNLNTDIKLWLNKNNITSIIDLINIWPIRFTQKFGRKLINKIVKDDGPITVDKLITFAKKLWRSLPESIKEKTNITTAIDFWKTNNNTLYKYKKYFWLLIDKSLNTINFKERVIIANALWLDTAKDIAQSIKKSPSEPYYRIQLLWLKIITIPIIQYYQQEIETILWYSLEESLTLDIYNKLQDIAPFNSKDEYIKHITTRSMRSLWQHMGILLGETSLTTDYLNKMKIRELFEKHILHKTQTM